MVGLNKRKFAVKDLLAVVFLSLIVGSAICVIIELFAYKPLVSGAQANCWTTPSPLPYSGSDGTPGADGDGSGAD